MRYTQEELNRLHEFDISASGEWHFTKGLMLKGSRHQAVQWLTDEIGPHHPTVQRFTKAAAPVLTSDGQFMNFGSRLTAVERLLRQSELLSRIPGTLPAAVGTHTPIIDEPATASWGIPFPAVTFNVTTVASEATSYGLIPGYSMEWLRRSGERGVRVIEAHTKRILRNAGDAFLLDDQAAVPGVRPAGLLQGVTSSGTGSPGSEDEGFQELLASVSGGDPEAPVAITSKGGAAYLAQHNRPLFKDVKVVGPSSIAGIPHLVSRAAGNRLILVDGAGLVVTDEGLFVDASRQASVVLDTTPGSPATMTSGFQTDTTFLRIVRTIHWIKTHADAVAYIELPLLSAGSPDWQ